MIGQRLCTALPLAIRAAASQWKLPAPGSQYNMGATVQISGGSTACDVLPSEGDMAAMTVWLK